MPSLPFNCPITGPRSCGLTANTTRSACWAVLRLSASVFTPNWLLRYSRRSVTGSPTLISLGPASLPKRTPWRMASAILPPPMNATFIFRPLRVTVLRPALLPVNAGHNYSTEGGNQSCVLAAKDSRVFTRSQTGRYPAPMRPLAGWTPTYFRGWLRPYRRYRRRCRGPLRSAQMEDPGWR